MVLQFQMFHTKVTNDRESLVGILLFKLADWFVEYNDDDSLLSVSLLRQYALKRGKSII